MGFRFIQQKQAAGVFIQEAQSQTVKELVFSVGQGFCIHIIFNTGFHENQIFKPNDPLVRRQHRYGFIHIKACRLIQIFFKCFTDRLQI